MTATAFNTAANTPQPYVFDFNREVAAFYRAYPEQKQRIYFIDVSTRLAAVCRGDEGDEGTAGAMLASNALVMESMKLAHAGGGRSDFYSDLKYGTVCLNLSLQSQKDLLGAEAGASLSAMFIFDHEAGHLLCKRGLGEGNLSECVADAYAVIRHIQRFGRNPAALGKLVERRTTGLVFGNGADHFTAPLVEKILADSAVTDFSALTPAQTVSLAENYAVNNPVDPAMIRHMMQEFHHLQPGFQRMLRGDFAALHQMGEIIRTTNDPNLFKWGDLALRAVLEGDVSINCQRLPKPAGHEWARLCEALDSHRARFGLPPRQKSVMRLR